VTVESPSIAKMLAECARNWRGHFRHIVYSKNLIGNVYRKFLTEHADIFQKYNYIITSDMDVEIDAEIPWKQCFDLFGLLSNVGVISLPCSDVNHTEICKGWQSIFIKNVKIASNGIAYGNPNNDQNTGWQCIIFSAQTAKRFFVESSVECVDYCLGAWLQQNQYNWIVLAEFKVKHLMWDAYNNVSTQPKDVQSYILWKNHEFVLKKDRFWHADSNDIASCKIILDTQLS
jgi:hypothetical protein